MSHYAVLGISDRQHDPSLTQQDIKHAYKCALLLHHPDKERRSPLPAADHQHASAVSIDDITTALKTLSDPLSKSEYDRTLRLANARDDTTGKTGKLYHTGLDTVDLDDLDFHESLNTWTRSCRCGQTEGFLVTEEELDKHADQGELITGCRGCSLWLKVLFGLEG